VARGFPDQSQLPPPRNAGRSSTQEVFGTLGHSLIEYDGNVAMFSDHWLHLVRCFLLKTARQVNANCPSTFLSEIIERLNRFEWLTTGVFSDLDLDSFICGDVQRLHLLLDLIDDSAALACENGSQLEPQLLNSVASLGGNEKWTHPIETELLLAGFGAVANLLMGLPSVYWYGQPISWRHDDLTRRMKQERLINHRKTQVDEQLDARETSAQAVLKSPSTPRSP